MIYAALHFALQEIKDIILYIRNMKMCLFMQANFVLPQMQSCCRWNKRTRGYEDNLFFISAKLSVLFLIWSLLYEWEGGGMQPGTTTPFSMIKNPGQPNGRMSRVCLVVQEMQIEDPIQIFMCTT